VRSDAFLFPVNNILFPLHFPSAVLLLTPVWLTSTDSSLHVTMTSPAFKCWWQFQLCAYS